VRAFKLAGCLSFECIKGSIFLENVSDLNFEISKENPQREDKSMPNLNL